jgi:hypothetical protein
MLPGTPIGRAGLVLAVVGLAAYAVALPFVDAVSAPVLLWGLPVAATVVGAVLAAIAVIRRGDRGVLAYAAIVPGAFFLLLLLAEAVGLME